MSQIKILLVDDREDNLISIEAILSETGYEFVKATSGKQALKILLKEHDFTLILMDVKMPDLSGFETAALIYERDKLKHIPIIFITAHSYSEEKVYEGYKTGAVDYIYKPINPQLLKAKVSVFVDLYKKNHQLILQEQKLISINKSLEEEILVRENSEKEIIQLNKKLRDNIEVLENANVELARFAYVASHDLQEPLRKIRAFGDLIMGKYYSMIDEEGQYYIDRIQNSAERMQNLIKDILAYSRISHPEDSHKETNVKVIVGEIIGDLELVIDQSNAKIKVDELPVIKANPGQLRQLFQNIITNALKFSKPGENPEIEIGYQLLKGKDIPGLNKNLHSEKYHQLYVKDKGIGFDECYSEQIFTLFKRLNDNSKYEGTGIGLAICKKIVEQHKGFITAKSKPNEGTTFFISLPIKTIADGTNSKQVPQDSYR